MVNEIICRLGALKISTSRFQSSNWGSAFSASVTLAITFFSIDPSEQRFTQSERLLYGAYALSMTSKSKVSATMTPRSYLPVFKASLRMAAGKARKMLPPPK